MSSRYKRDDNTTILRFRLAGSDGRWYNLHPKSRDLENALASADADVLTIKLSDLVCKYGRYYRGEDGFNKVED